ncbi:MAG TPA: polysaccharide deacetylase family protein [Chitinophagaceae bacterium]|nr:polysaccharide deacetylase family protein [Chitinophagaceae bacterium]
MLYLTRTPYIIRRWLYPRYIWRMPADDKKLYLTFDDGPHPDITPFVLDELKRYNAKATFFCIGDNVARYPQVYKRILEEGHAIGNHTHNHLNGWRTGDEAYFKNISEAANWIDSKLFRPPYGRITRFQAKQLMEKLQYNIIMWDVLSGDFDIQLSPERCLKNVVRNLRPGAIIVFHDSEKAYKRLSYALPKVLEEGRNKGYSFDKIIL